MRNLKEKARAPDVLLVHIFSEGFPVSDGRGSFKTQLDGAFCLLGLYGDVVRALVETLAQKKPDKSRVWMYHLTTVIS